MRTKLKSKSFAHFQFIRFRNDFNKQNEIENKRNIESKSVFRYVLPMLKK